MRRLGLGLMAAVAAALATPAAVPVAQGAGPAAPAAAVVAPPAAFGGFRTRSRGLPLRPRRGTYRPYRRTRVGHPFRAVLRVLGIAFLVHALFGWGPGGGSPFGLLIVLALVAWLVLRRRRRERFYGRPGWRT